MSDSKDIQLNLDDDLETTKHKISEHLNKKDDNKSTENIEKTVKKRGRKPKIKIEEGQENENKTEVVVEKVLKKRGRKPKEKTEPEIQKIPKKRGRKPKEKIYSVKELPKTFYEENKNETLILHLPIQEDELQTDPQPIEQENHHLKFENNIKIEGVDNLPTQMNFLDHEDNNIETDEKDEFDIKKQKAWENNNNQSNKVIKKNLRNILYEFIDFNKNKEWPEKTNINCWWCCHTFDNVPCSLPYSYKKDKFCVKGVFCNFNCAASYNFSLNDENVYERYSLLNLMYKKLYYRKFIKINLAPPRESLKMFGGYLSIDEFREYCLECDRIFNLIDPPLVSIIPKIEESINQNKNFSNNLGLHVNENILQKTQDTLKLKRNKPIYNPSNSLQTFMDLKII